jgi:hypothetical protein
MPVRAFSMSPGKEWKDSVRDGNTRHNDRLKSRKGVEDLEKIVYRNVHTARQEANYSFSI